MVYIKKKNVRVAMELEVLKVPIFRPTLSIVMVQQVLWWEKQNRFSRFKCQRTMVEKCRSIVTRKEVWEKVKHEEIS